MFRITITVFSILSLLILSCKEPAQKNLLPELTSCDSAAVMYYHKPGNPRFFNMTKLFDKTSLSLIAADINGEIIRAKDTCATQGKIYYYGKGDAVYIAYFTRANECMTLSFIKTGNKYFVKMSEDVKKLLDGLQAKATEPKAL
ncbi:hypothetical protein [Terrimonas pollutisoli]|uniref:hypothetical protein n=1 Tax=Terrimonas pollutisoli TaxID=3034147 RepID=UPI0023EC97B6|nr:hypothetical protein [Terrimonas sp. H1YJ31]